MSVVVKLLCTRVDGVLSLQALDDYSEALRLR